MLKRRARGLTYDSARVKESLQAMYTDVELRPKARLELLRVNVRSQLYLLKLKRVISFMIMEKKKET